MSLKNPEKTLKFLMSLKRKIDPPFQGEPFDVIIPVMGPTGVGKSTFINSLLHSIGKTGMSVAVGHGLSSCTSELNPIVIEEFGHSANGFTNPNTENEGRLVIVDTPGFDDSVLTDGEVLRRISVWLAMSYATNMKVGGVIYLHDITQTRMLGTTRNNLDMFRKLVGPDAPRCVFFGTTKWSLLADPRIGLEREQMLLSELPVKEMMRAGSRIVSVRDQTAPREIVNRILNRARLTRSKVEFLKIQVELAGLRKFVPETEAGMTLQYSLDELLQLQNRRVEKLSDEEYKRQRQELDQLLMKAKELKVPLGKRIMKFFNMQAAVSYSH